MMAHRWREWLGRLGARDVARRSAVPFGRDLSHTYPAARHVEVGDVPVFDQHHRQVGVIPCCADIVDDFEVTQARWMSHCLNDPVTWSPREVDAGELSRLLGTASLYRVPLVDNNHQVRGVVVFEAAIRPARRNVASLDHRTDAAGKPGR